MQNWIETKAQLDDVQDQKKSAAFHVMLKTDITLRKYRLLLEITGEAEKLSGLQTACSEYFMAEQPGTDILKETQEAISNFDKIIQQIEENPIVGTISNFFARWFSKNDAEKKKLYAMLLDDKIASKIKLDNGAVEKLIISNTTEQKEVYFSPYEVNRVFLHALLVDPGKHQANPDQEYDQEQWLPDFAKLLPEVLRFVKNNFNQENTGIAAALKRDSYPDSLIKQLEYLNNVHNNVPEEKNPRCTMEILLPERIKTAQEWLTFLKLLTSDWLDRIYQAYYITIKQVLMGEITKLHPDRARLDIKACRDIFTNFLNRIPPSRIEHFLSLLNENFLSNVVDTPGSINRLLSDVSHAIYLDVVKYIEKNIQTIDLDVRCLLIKRIPEQNRLVHMKNGSRRAKMRDLIVDVQDLYMILEPLPDTDRLDFITFIGRDCRAVMGIRTIDDLIKITRLISGADRLNFVTFIGREFLTDLIKNQSEAVIQTIYSLFPENHRIAMIEADIRQNPIDSFEKLARCLRLCSTDEHKKQILDGIKEELLIDLINNQNDLLNFLQLIPGRLSKSYKFPNLYIDLLKNIYKQTNGATMDITSVAIAIPGLACSDNVKKHLLVVLIRYYLLVLNKKQPSYCMRLLGGDSKADDFRSHPEREIAGNITNALYTGEKNSCRDQKPESKELKAIYHAYCILISDDQVHSANQDNRAPRIGNARPDG